MAQFHTDEYVDFLARITPDNMDNFGREQAKCRFASHEPSLLCERPLRSFCVSPRLLMPYLFHRHTSPIRLLSYVQST